ncbi:unnamed protein product [Rotaria sp. Silwood1]|nr:unnamed protein product [Rotaria sp. Silwood1]CAF5096545.1 unnamed protein product [Rotaria sp. Silwood1]
MFDHKTLSMPDDFMSPIFTNDNVVFNQAHYESSNEQYKPENDHDSQHATTIVQNMLFDTDNIELPASMMNLMDDFQNIPTPQSFSNLFETAFPSSYSEDMTTDTTMVADVMTVNNTSYTTDTPYGTQLTIVMMPFQISTLINNHPYPPTNMYGPITEHDRPYSKYGHLNKVTGDQCNYDVTNNDMAWNEYIKKNGDFIEIGDFKSITTRSRLGVWASSEFVRAQKKKKQN